eukprot:TRINITY_DN11199_c0_g1_i2.p1 TRINITY_DN11199_c0_g1~~TRINITY_DN11199_c0_g1_i2.p1  ORF type:complete len:360 (-),score=68.10 TRINITY_DN11199_c0_g1_i2:496-1575(-)
MPTAETRLGSELLQGVLARTPSHPMAEHLWIHITEPSASGMGPESAGRAAAAADGLLAQFNGTDSQHLTHMPGHTYLRVGRYNDAVKVNIAAHRQDERYLSAEQVPYGPAHNAAFLVYAAAMDGQADKAYEYSSVLRDIYRAAPDRGDGPGPEVGWNIALTSFLRFGEYRALLDDDEQPPRMWPYSTVLRAYSRALALVRTGELELAAQENTALQSAAQNVSGDYAKLVKVANLTVAATLAQGHGDAAAAEALLEQAAEEQVSWAYDEPPSWHVPMRQCLGQVQLNRGRFKQAMRTYESDLQQYPKNGFSLYGRAEAMAGQPQKYTEKQVEAARSEARVAWERSSVPLTSSCTSFEVTP